MARFDASGKLLKTLDLNSLGAPLRESAGVALDANGGVRVASGVGGTLHLSRLDRQGNVSPFGEPVNVGGSAKVGRLRLARQGGVLIAGDAGGVGFVAALSQAGELLWVRSFAKVVTIFDIVESDDGIIAAGGTAGDMSPDSVWLARLGGDGTVLEEQARRGPTRYAHLASSGRRVGLLYEQLEAGLESGSVLLELFESGGTLRQAGRRTLFEGSLAAPFVLAGANGRFTAAGVARHGRLHVIDIDAGGKLTTLHQEKAKAPDFVRYHAVDLVRSAGAIYLGALRSRADSRRQQAELVLARIPAP